MHFKTSLTLHFLSDDLASTMINLFTIFFITNLLHCLSNKILNYNQKNCESDLLDFSQLYFRDRNCLTFIEVLSTNFSINLFYKTHKLPRKVLKISNFNATKPKIRPRRDDISEDGVIRSFCQDSYEGFAVFARTLDEFRGYALGGKVSPLLNPQGKILVVVEDTGDFQGFYREMWPLYKAPNLVFLDGSCRVFFYNKFLQDGGKWGKVLEFDLGEIRDDPLVVVNTLMDLNQYPFRTILFFSLMAYQIVENSTFVDYGGMDGELLKVLEKWMNFSKVILLKQPKANYGEKTPNGTFNGALKFLLDGEVDLICISYFIKDYLTRDVEFSATGMQDDLCCNVHKSGKIPIWEIFYVYYEVWLMLFCSYFIIGFIWSIIQKFDAKIHKKPTSPSIFLDTLRLMIVNSFPRLPSIASERIFLVFTMMAFVTFLGAFQGSLMTILSKPSFYPDVTSLEQLAATDYPILTRFEAIKNDMFGDDPTNPITVKLRKMVKLNTDKLSAEALIARDGNCAGILRRSSAEIENKTR